MKTIVCHGDSLTEGRDIAPAYRWTALAATKLGIEVRNTGIGGDTSAGLLSRFTVDVVNHAPDAVLILCGTNDLWWDLDLRLIQANIYAMTCQAEFHGIAPVIGTPLPVCLDKIDRQAMMTPYSGYETCLEKLSRLVDALKASARSNDIPCINFYQPFLDDSGAVRADCFLDDGLHANKTGHRIMAACVTAALTAAFNLPG